MKSIMLKSLGQAQTIFSLWMDSVAQTAADAVERLSSPLKVSLIEGENGELLLSGGNLAEIPADLASALRDSCVDVELRPDHFLFRPLELPNRATEFLDGIVRSQLDRLMPWNAANTAYGWSKPTEIGGDRMTITVAGTSVEVIKPLCRALADAGARSIQISVAPLEPAADSILIWEEKTQGQSQACRIRRVLVAIIAAVGVSTVLTVGSWGLVVTNLESEQSQITHEITAQLGEGKADQIIAVRKQSRPSAVLIIEALSRILSDQTYVTELRIDGSKLYLTGVTRDAPSLIETLERSGQFTHATFFAPTTRSQSDATERFHIEATVDLISWPHS